VEPDVKEKLENILSKYSGQSGDLLPILQEVQDVFGYIPKEALRRVAKFLWLAESTVYGVTTFYEHFRLAPEGENVVSVCQGPACHLRGGDQILREVEGQLGIKMGETTEDRKYTLARATCSGTCAFGPIMQINGKVYKNMTPEQVKQVLAENK